MNMQRMNSLWFTKSIFLDKSKSFLYLYYYYLGLLDFVCGMWDTWYASMNQKVIWRNWINDIKHFKMVCDAASETIKRYAALSVYYRKFQINGLLIGLPTVIIFIKNRIYLFHLWVICHLGINSSQHWSHQFGIVSHHFHTLLHHFRVNITAKETP